MNISNCLSSIVFLANIQSNLSSINNNLDNTINVITKNVFNKIDHLNQKMPKALKYQQLGLKDLLDNSHVKNNAFINTVIKVIVIGIAALCLLKAFLVFKPIILLAASLFKSYKKSGFEKDNIHHMGFNEQKLDTEKVKKPANEKNTSESVKVETVDKPVKENDLSSETWQNEFNQTASNSMSIEKTDKDLNLIELNNDSTEIWADEFVEKNLDDDVNQFNNEIAEISEPSNLAIESWPKEFNQSKEKQDAKLENIWKNSLDSSNWLSEYSDHQKTIMARRLGMLCMHLVN